MCLCPLSLYTTETGLKGPEGPPNRSRGVARLCEGRERGAAKYTRSKRSEQLKTNSWENVSPPLVGINLDEINGPKGKRGRKEHALTREKEREREREKKGRVGNARCNEKEKGTENRREECERTEWGNESEQKSEKKGTKEKKRAATSGGADGKERRREEGTPERTAEQKGNRERQMSIKAEWKKTGITHYGAA
ncbi:hypothetical protein ZHAS_00020412 [Anopheles sinensis]|uniref:Uncharacterized protein n=1 Tax=Anopheles sinensis TaxID=74873 RepID=A0A084WPZ8_ANOSI|nr:hypothetical protein ZHAS_00020412 [Anopheles sinensis]